MAHSFETNCNVVLPSSKRRLSSDRSLNSCAVIFLIKTDSELLALHDISCNFDIFSFDCIISNRGPNFDKTVRGKFFVRFPSKYLQRKCGTREFLHFGNELWHFEFQFQQFSKDYHQLLHQNLHISHVFQAIYPKDWLEMASIHTETSFSSANLHKKAGK